MAKRAKEGEWSISTFSPLHPTCHAVSDGSLQSHDALLCRIHSLMGTDVREAHARISLHKQSQGGPPPTTDAIHKWLEQNQEKRQGIREADIRAAFRSGEEVGLVH